MKHLLITFLALIQLCGCSECGETTVKTPLPDGIKTAIDYYVGGSPTADSTITAKGFYPTATMSWVENDTFQCVPISSLFKFVASEPMSASYNIEDYSVEGDIAMVRISSKFGDAEFVDMFSLVRSNGEWKIVSKIYTNK